MLDIGIVFWVICDDVVDIVAKLPPTNRKSTKEIC